MKWEKSLHRTVLEQLQKNTTSVTQMSRNTMISKKAIDGELFRISQVSNMEFWLKWDRNDTAQITIPLREIPVETLEWLIKWLYTKDKHEGKVFTEYSKEKDRLPDGIMAI